ncbi:MAG TPA: CBS domain-containing protein [Pyrinomonadaceae bacterium]|nr:CBS domain-containing protein [Pyrinomonadaceae bacterium]
MFYNSRTLFQLISGGQAMITIRDVIREREPYSVRDDVTALEAAEYMAKRKVGGVCVLDEDGRLIGILTERDLLHSIVVPCRDPATLTVREVMSELKAVIETKDTPREALERMELIGRRHLPVVEGERWVGMLSMRDILRVEVNEQGDELKLLHEYISH